MQYSYHKEQGREGTNHSKRNRCPYAETYVGLDARLWFIEICKQADILRVMGRTGDLTISITVQKNNN